MQGLWRLPVLVKMKWLDGACTSLRHPANRGSDAGRLPYFDKEDKKPFVSAPKLGTKRPSCPIPQVAGCFLAQIGPRVRFSKGDKTGLYHLQAI